VRRVKAILLLAALLPALSVSPSADAYTCEQVRTWHRQYGTARLLQLAKLYGVTAAQKRAAVRCIRQQGFAYRLRSARSR